jgi:hypothetical protein
MSSLCFYIVVAVEVTSRGSVSAHKSLPNREEKHVAKTERLVQKVPLKLDRCPFA